MIIILGRGGGENNHACLSNPFRFRRPQLLSVTKLLPESLSSFVIVSHTDPDLAPRTFTAKHASARTINGQRYRLGLEPQRDDDAPSCTA